MKPGTHCVPVIVHRNPVRVHFKVRFIFDKFCETLSDYWFKLTCKIPCGSRATTLKMFLVMFLAFHESTGETCPLTVVLTSLFRAVLQTSLGNWVLGYELASYVANHTVRLQTSKRSSELQRKWRSQLWSSDIVNYGVFSSGNNDWALESLVKASYSKLWTERFQG